jgi:hypothetical protein
MLTSKQLNSKIAGIKRSTSAIRKNIHEVLCNAAGHAYEHGDVTFYDRLIEATSGVNQKRIATWIKDNGFAVWNKEEERYNVNKSARDKADFADGFAVAMHLFTEVAPWYEDTKVKTPDQKALDIDTALQSLVKRIGNANDLRKIDTATLQARFEEIVGAYNAKVEASWDAEREAQRNAA